MFTTWYTLLFALSSYCISSPAHSQLDDRHQFFWISPGNFTLNYPRSSSKKQPSKGALSLRVKTVFPHLRIACEPSPHVYIFLTARTRRAVAQIPMKNKIAPAIFRTCIFFTMPTALTAIAAMKSRNKIEVTGMCPPLFYIYPGTFSGASLP
jgi:hypothetical protein